MTETLKVPFNRSYWVVPGASGSLAVRWLSDGVGPQQPAIITAKEPKNMP
jgi:hypothetical protein